MTVARDPLPLPTLVTDAGYNLDVEVYGTSDADPLDQSAFDFVVVFAPSGQRNPDPADVHSYSTADRVVVIENVVSLALLLADVEDWSPGDYLVEYRRAEGASYSALYAAIVPVVAGVGGGGGAIPPGGPPGVRLITKADTVKILRGEAAGGVAQAAAAAQSAADDATATAADRVQTGLDAAATAADRTATHADKLAADADAVATAADRVQTGLDRVATGADRTATHTDKLAADADAVATAADRVQTGLDRVATGADRTATHADKLAADADAVATAADRVQTGLDRASASASAATALAALAAINTPTPVSATGASAVKTWEGLNSSGGSIIRSLPASPAANDWVRYSDIARACTGNPVTISRNGNTIEGSAEDLLLDVDGDDYALIWTGATWTIL